eukprot:gene11039-3108_t
MKKDPGRSTSSKRLKNTLSKRRSREKLEKADEKFCRLRDDLLLIIRIRKKEIEQLKWQLIREGVPCYKIANIQRKYRQ